MNYIKKNPIMKNLFWECIKVAIEYAMNPSLIFLMKKKFLFQMIKQAKEEEQGNKKIGEKEF